MIINIAQDYTSNIGEGRYTGTDFLERILLPNLNLALANNEKLIINLDNLQNYSINFFQESFGNLTTYFSKEEIIKTIEFVLHDDILVVNIIQELIANSNKQRVLTKK